MIFIYGPGCSIRDVARSASIATMHLSRDREIAMRVRNRRVTSPAVNWGCRSSLLRLFRAPTNILNADISIPISKIRTFEALQAKGIRVPTWSREWQDIYQRGKYLARCDGMSGGKGIEIIEEGREPNNLNNYEFYTLVIAKAYEMRIHIFKNQIICEQFKFVPEGSGVIIRNYDNGARFSTKPLESHLTRDQAQEARTIAINSIHAAGVDFGAVDMILSRKGNLYVLEINTAPGISMRDESVHTDVPDTFTAYRNALNSL